MRLITDLQLEKIEELKEMVVLEGILQVQKWGVQTRTPAEWLMYLGEEQGELCEAIAEFEYRGAPKENVIKEAIQTATLVLKIAEMYMDK